MATNRKKVLVIGSKPYSNFKLNKIADSFDIIYRCNLAWPGRNNGTKFGRLVMSSPIYPNFVAGKVLSKERVLEVYSNGYHREYLSDWYDFFQLNKTKFEEILYVPIGEGVAFNATLKSYGCPHRFTKLPRTGYITIFNALKNPFNEVYVMSFSLAGDEYRISTGLTEEASRSEGEGCHSMSDEINILTWLHNNKKVDASLCMLNDTKELSIQADNGMKPSEFILDLINKNV